MNIKKQVGIFVIGDIGRSPRMVNHAVEFLGLPGCQVEIVGLLETELPAALRTTAVSVHRLPTFYLKPLKALPSILYLILRLIIEFWILLFFLLIKRFRRYDMIFVQNPPAIPLLPALFIYKLFSRCEVHVDVHNFGFTLFQTRSPLLRAVMQFLEILFVRITANRVYTVSAGMREVLTRRWRVRDATVLYDQPNGRIFRKLRLEEKHEFLKTVPELSGTPSETVITRLDKAGTKIERREDSVLFVISSSWSHDDNFPIFIAALELFKQTCPNPPRKLTFVCTGTGPVKERFAPMLLALQDQRVQICLKWLKTEEYPQLIACADFGISLHDSTSGFDLPIKILDYFGCSVPAIAFNYSPTIGELVQPGRNGYLFSTAEELRDILVKTAEGRERTEWKFGGTEWTKEWEQKVKLPNKL